MKIENDFDTFAMYHIVIRPVERVEAKQVDFQVCFVRKPQIPRDAKENHTDTGTVQGSLIMVRSRLSRILHVIFAVL